MTRREKRLEQIKFEEPCPASWNAMEGTEERRYCDQCDLHVQNLSAMPRQEAESLLDQRERGDRLCIRVEYLPDGQCVTAETPLAVRSGPGRIVAAALALGASLAACNSAEPVANLEAEGITDLNNEAEKERVLLGSAFIDFREEPNEMLGEVSLGEELETPECDPAAIVGRPSVVMGTPGPRPPEDQ